MNKLHSILRTIRNTVVKLFLLFPLRNIILFESNPDFNDEGYWVCQKFIDEKSRHQMKIYWILQEHSLDNKPESWDINYIFWYPANLIEWIKKWYVLSTARIIVDTCSFVPKLRKRQFRMFILHGMPMKNIDSYISTIGDFDFFNIGAEFFGDYYISRGLDKKRLVSLGLARNDQLGIKGNIFRETFGIENEKKLIIWMPTYRQHKTNNENVSLKKKQINETGLPIVITAKMLEDLNGVLQKNNSTLVIKIHQSQNLSLISVGNFSNIILLTTELLFEKKLQLYEILGEFDALLTDYSSIYFDYLLLDRPIGLTIDDIEEYKNKIGFTFDYDEYVKGFMIKDNDDLYTFIDSVNQNSDELVECLGTCKNTFNDITSFDSAELIYRFICDKVFS